MAQYVGRNWNLSSNKMMHKLVLASHNQGKLRELQSLLGDDFHLFSLAEFSSESAIENGLTFVENAVIKARFAAKISNLPALADDSGLMVNHLNGSPGIYSARFSTEATDSSNNYKLLNLLLNVPENQRSAQFVCVLALVNHADDPLPLICQGIWRGKILSQAVGDRGFGYDPIFAGKNPQDPDKYDVFAGNLDESTKNKISHRAKAFMQLKEQISTKLVVKS